MAKDTKNCQKDDKKCPKKMPKIVKSSKKLPKHLTFGDLCHQMTYLTYHIRHPTHYTYNHGNMGIIRNIRI